MEEAYDELLQAYAANSGQSISFNTANAYLKRKRTLLDDASDVMHASPNQWPVEDVLTVYRNAILTNRLPRFHRHVVHECNEECIQHMISYKDVYLCLITGNIHYCTELACTHATTNDQERVCTLTANRFGSDIDHRQVRVGKDAITGDAGVFIGTGPSILASTISIDKSVTHSLKEIKTILVAPSPSTQHKEPTANNKQKRKRRRRIESELPLIQSMTSALMAKMNNLAPHEDMFVSTAHQLWNAMILPSQVYQNNSGAYTLSYHVCVLIYRAQRGLSLFHPDRYSLVPNLTLGGQVSKSSWSNMRRLSDVKINNGLFSASTFTNTTHLFTQCVAELRTRVLEAEEKMKVFLIKMAGKDVSIYKESQVDVSKVRTQSEKVLVWDSVTIDWLQQRMGVNWKEIDGFHIRCELNNSELDSFTITVYS